MDSQHYELRALHLTGAEKGPLASRTSSRTLGARHVLCHRRHLPKKDHFFRTADRIQVLHRGLLTVTCDYGWQLEAWAVFSNHYHFVAHSPDHEDSAESLSGMLGLLHEKTAKWINRLDCSLGRQVWHNFWETKLTYQKSYLARLNYVHQNPVKHGLVVVANQYPWCSARWFERTARPAQIKTIYSLKTDRVKVYDDYEGDDEW